MGGFVFSLSLPSVLRGVKFDFPVSNIFRFLPDSKPLRVFLVRLTFLDWPPGYGIAKVLSLWLISEGLFEVCEGADSEF